MKRVIAIVSTLSLVLTVALVGNPIQVSATTPLPVVIYGFDGNPNYDLYVNYAPASMPMAALTASTYGMVAIQRLFSSSDGSRLFISGPLIGWANYVILELGRSNKNTVTQNGSSLSLPTSGWLAAMTPNGSKLLYTSSSGVYRIDISSGKSLYGTHITMSTTILDVAVSPDSNYVYVLTADNKVDKYSIDMSTHQTGFPVTVGAQYISFSSIAVGPNGHVWVTNGGGSGHTVSILNSDGSNVSSWCSGASGNVCTVDVGYSGTATTPGSLAITSDGHYVYVGNRLATNNHGYVSLVDATQNPPAVVTGTGYPIDIQNNNGGGVTELSMAPDGAKVYVSETVVHSGDSYSGKYTVAVIDTSTKAVSQIVMPHPTSWIMATPFPVNLGVGNDYPGYSNPDPWGFVPSNCTSFLAWRWHRDGHDVTWSGNAGLWDNNAVGKTVNNTPAVGNIAVWESGQSMLYSDGSSAGNAGGTGHVAYVTSVETDGTYWIEQYNWGSPTLTYKGPWHLKVTTSGGVTWPKFIHQ